MRILMSKVSQIVKIFYLSFQDMDNDKKAAKGPELSEGEREASAWRRAHAEALIRAREVEQKRLAAVTKASLDALDKHVQKYMKKQ